MGFIIGLGVVCVLLALYIAWRDRRRGRGPASQSFVEQGEGKSAAYAAQLHRGTGGGMGGAG